MGIMVISPSSECLKGQEIVTQSLFTPPWNEHSNCIQPSGQTHWGHLNTQSCPLTPAPSLPSASPLLGPRLLPPTHPLPAHTRRAPLQPRGWCINKLHRREKVTRLASAEPSLTGAQMSCAEVGEPPPQALSTCELFLIPTGRAGHSTSATGAPGGQPGGQKWNQRQQ